MLILQCVVFKGLGLFFEEHGLWLWLWGIKLVVDMGCNFKDDLLSGCCATVFPHNCVFLCWYSVWYWCPVPYCCRRFVTIPLLLKGDWILEHLAWQIRTSSSFNCICFFRFPLGGLLCNFNGNWWFFLQVEKGLIHMGLPSGNLVRAYNKGKEGELCHGNWLGLFPYSFSCLFRNLSFYIPILFQYQFLAHLCTNPGPEIGFHCCNVQFAGSRGWYIDPLWLFDIPNLTNRSRSMTCWTTVDKIYIRSDCHVSGLKNLYHRSFLWYYCMELYSTYHCLQWDSLWTISRLKKTSQFSIG